MTEQYHKTIIEITLITIPGYAPSSLDEIARDVDENTRAAGGFRIVSDEPVTQKEAESIIREQAGDWGYLPTGEEDDEPDIDEDWDPTYRPGSGDDDYDEAREQYLEELDLLDPYTDPLDTLVLGTSEVDALTVVLSLDTLPNEPEWKRVREVAAGLLGKLSAINPALLPMGALRLTVTTAECYVITLAWETYQEGWAGDGAHLALVEEQMQSLLKRVAKVNFTWDDIAVAEAENNR